MKSKLYHILPYLILLAGLVATVFLFNKTKQLHESRKFERFAGIVRQVEAAIPNQMANYADAHYAGASLFVTADTVTLRDWRVYVRTLNLAGRYPGINGLGYVRAVTKSDSAAFLKWMQRRVFREYSVGTMNLMPPQMDMYLIQYIEPLPGNFEALGFDMGSEPVRRKALDMARDSGKVGLSGKVALVQDTTRSPGFLMFVPVYKNDSIPATVEGRRERFAGWVYAPFMASNFMKGLLGMHLKEIRHLFSIEIYDGYKQEEGNLLYRSPDMEEALAYDTKLNALRHIPLYHQTWTVQIAPSAEFLRRYHTDQPWLTLIGGLMVSFLLFAVARQQARTREKAEALAASMTREYRRTNEELEAKNLELERSNHDLEQFAYVASHDLKEPLRMVKSYVQLLEARYKKNLDDDGKLFISYAAEGAERMGNLINDLLNYSRVGRIGNELGPVDVDEVLESVLQHNEIQIEEAGAQIIRSELPVVTGSENYLFRLFQNLISNALKFRDPSRALVIRIKAEREGHFWRFSVQDNGIGIDGQYLDRIFVIFQRLHTRDEYSGTGIGLAICKKIVEFHGGRIWAESTPGDGTTFYFTLPAEESGAKA